MEYLSSGQKRGPASLPWNFGRSICADLPERGFPLSFVVVFQSCCEESEISDSYLDNLNIVLTNLSFLGKGEQGRPGFGWFVVETECWCQRA